MSRDAVLTIFDEIRSRVLRIDDQHPEQSGRAFAMMPLGHPLNADEFRDPWGPMSATKPGSTNEEKIAEILRRKQSAYSLATFVDQRIRLNSPGTTMLTSAPISGTWRIIVENATLAGTPPAPNPASKKRVQEALEYLTDPDPQDGELLVYSKAQIAYDKYKQEYDKAKGAYTAAFQKASKDPGLLATWGTDGAVYAGAVTLAFNQWQTLGFKDKVEAAQNIVATEGKNAVESVIGAAKKLLRAWEVDAGGNVGAEATYQFTQIFPKDWAEADSPDSGWTQLVFTESQTSSTHSTSASSWGASGGIGFGFWGIGGGGGGSTFTEHSEFSSSSIGIRLTIGVVTISRPWLSTLLLNTKGWGLPGVGRNEISNGSILDQDLPDGAQPSTWLPSIPTQLVIVKNFSIKTDDIQNFYDHVQQNSGGSASFGWGPFRVSGASNWSSSSTASRCRMEGGWLHAEGAQLIGYVLEATPAAPPESLD